MGLLRAGVEALSTASLRLLCKLERLADFLDG